MGRETIAYLGPGAITRTPVRAPGAQGERQSLFSVSSYTLNRYSVSDTDEGVPFPGNIQPEGYFYSPFYEIALKELDDELQTASTKRINFVPSAVTTTASSATTRFYIPDMGVFEDRVLWKVSIASPVSYDFLPGQPFCIYDIKEEMTYRGYLNGFSSMTNGGSILDISTEQEIDIDGLRGESPGANGNSRYIISMLEGNAPGYAEYIPSSGKLVWRGLKKMSDLTSDSPIYNMPFANGRLYIHHNVNVFVRRQDPHGEYKLFRPSKNNPLRRYQIEGDSKLDLDYVQYIIDSMVDAC